MYSKCIVNIQHRYIDVDFLFCNTMDAHSTISKEKSDKKIFEKQFDSLCNPFNNVMYKVNTINLPKSSIFSLQ